MYGLDPIRIAPFGYLRIISCLPIPAAFRSLPRPSSAPDAKASSLRSYQLNLFSHRIMSHRFNRRIFEIVITQGVPPFAVPPQVPALNSKSLAKETVPLSKPSFGYFTFAKNCFPLCCFRYSIFKVLFRNCETIAFHGLTFEVSPCYCWWAQMDSNHRPQF